MGEPHEVSSIQDTGQANSVLPQWQGGTYSRLHRRRFEEGQNLETALRQVAGSGHLGWLAHFVSGSEVPSSSALGSREIQTARLDEERPQPKQVSHRGRPKQGGDEGLSHTAERRGGRMGRPRPPPTWFSSIGATSHNSELLSVAVPASQGPSVFNSHGETHSV